MYDWNKDYKNRPYNTYGSNYGDDIKLGYGYRIIISISIIIAILGLVMWLDGYIKAGGGNSIISKLFCWFIAISIALYIVVAICRRVMAWCDRTTSRWFGPLESDYTTYNSTKSTASARKLLAKNSIRNRVVRTLTSSELIVGERKRPPRASFFGRLNGEPKESLGTYEEQWLSVYELAHWMEQKESKQAHRDGSANENDEFSSLCVNTTTKITY